MRDLIAKLEALDEPSREVEVLIWRTFDRPDAPIGREPLPWLACYTASLDAAVALVEWVLPGWDWGVKSLGEDGCEGKVWKHGWHDDTVIRADHKSSPAIALLIAALKALEARDG